MSDKYERPIYYYSIAEDLILVLQTIRDHDSEFKYRTDDCGERQADKQ